MAPSFLTLPPELRLQIYQYLLCHSSEIGLQKCEQPLYWAVYRRRLYRATEALSLDSAILGTCRTVYAEAKPVLYGENTFFFLCWTSRFNIYEYRKTGFADKNLKYLKHLVIEVGNGYFYAKKSAVEGAAEGVADAIQYLVKQGGSLRTFELALNEQEDHFDDDEKREHNMLRAIAASQNFMTALVALNVSEVLAISVQYLESYDAALQSSEDDELQDLFQDLIGKKMNATKQEPELIHRKTSEVDDDPVEEEGEAEGEEEDEDEEDEEAYYGYERTPTTYKMSWYLDPQRPEQQSAAMMTSAST